MSTVNKVILIGNLGADPELNYTSNGTAVANLSLATSSKVSGEDKTEWHRVTVWDKTAENVAKYMSKGSKMYVEGRLQTRSFEDAEGNTRYTTEVVANQVTFLDSKSADKEEAPATKGKSSSQSKRRHSRDEIPF